MLEDVLRRRITELFFMHQDTSALEKKISFPSSKAADLLETRGGRSALRYDSPSTPLILPQILTGQKGKKNLIKLFRSASPNFLSRSLALELWGRAGTERAILREEQQGGTGVINATSTTQHASVRLLQT